MYRLIAVFLLIIFYGAYFAKMLIQKRKGIVTDQMGKRRRRDKGFYIEVSLKAMTILMPLAQLASIIYGRSASMASASSFIPWPDSLQYSSFV